MYYYVHGSLPHSLSGIFIFTYDILIHETRQTSHIRPFISSTERSSNSLLCKGPMIWNIIPPIIQNKPNLNSFVLSLKAHVVREYCVLA